VNARDEMLHCTKATGILTLKTMSVSMTSELFFAEKLSVQCLMTECDKQHGPHCTDTKITGTINFSTLHAIKFEEIWPTLQYTSEQALHDNKPFSAQSTTDSSSQTDDILQSCLCTFIAITKIF
jgi:hypothetical protein